MFDTMTLTKITGAGCGALLIFLLGNWAAESIYEPGGGGEHGEETASYVIEVADAGGEGGSEDEAVDFATVMASADTGKGERVFSKCKACHKLEEGANGTGPTLYGVVGREVASVPGFGYSGALKPVADVWTPEHLSGFLANPKKYAPGTKMGFAGLKKVDDRANLIAYLSTIGS